MTKKIETILITGGAGFIGSHLTGELLEKDYEVICLDNFDPFYDLWIKENNVNEFSSNNSYTLIRGDIRDVSTLDSIFEKHQIDLVIHLAAKAGIRPSLLNPKEYFDVNVMGTLNILDSMKAHRIERLIFASSSSIYGNNKKVPYSETDDVSFPISPYAASKKSGELLTHTYHALYDIKVINLRFFTVYGPRQRPDLAIHKFFTKLYEKESIEIYGDGSTSRDYTYITDIISGILGAINYLENNKAVYETINIGSKNSVVLTDLISLIEEVTEKKFRKIYTAMQMGDVNKTFADINKAKQLLGYNPYLTLREGLIKFKEWYEKKR
jgi:UDP-glucuronate 4-epimerase